MTPKPCEEPLAAKGEDEGGNEDEKREVVVIPTFGLWLVIPLGILTFGASVGLPISVSVMFVDWQETFQTNRTHTAAVHSTLLFFLFGSSVLAGYLSFRIGARATMLIGSALATLGFILSMFAQTVDHLVLTTGVLGGFGCCFIQIPLIPAIAVLCVPKYKGLVISLCTISSAVVVSFFPLLYNHLVQYHSWRSMYCVFAGTIVQTFVTGMVITSVKTIHKTSERLISPKPSPTLDSKEYSALSKDPETTALVDELEDVTIDPHKDDNIQLQIDMDMPNNHSQYTDEVRVREDSVKRYDLNQESVKNSTQAISITDRIRKSLEQIRKSKWHFVMNRLFILFTLHSAIGVASMYSFPLFLTDVAKTRGFSKLTGVLFFSVTFISSIIGRIVVGVLNTSPRFHSISLFVFFSFECSILLLCLCFVRTLIPTFIILGFYGIGIGAVIAMQMKCIVDIKVIDSKSYPLALGICCTAEGICDFILALLIGYSADSTGSYTLILAILGCAGLIITGILAIEFWKSTKKEQARMKDEKAKRRNSD